MAKKTRRKKKTRGRRVGAGRGPGRPSRLSGMSTSDLMREIERRQGQLAHLESEREELRKRLDTVESEIAALGGSASAPVRRGPGRPRKNESAAPAARTRRAPSRNGRRRPRNEMTLEDAMAKVLDGKTLGVMDIAKAVQAEGYRTNAANFRTIVNQTLIKSPRFKKVARGQYTAA